MTTYAEKKEMEKLFADVIKKNSDGQRYIKGWNDEAVAKTMGNGVTSLMVMNFRKELGLVLKRAIAEPRDSRLSILEKKVDALSSLVNEIASKHEIASFLKFNKALGPK